MPHIFLALGSNLGDRLASLQQAIERLSAYVEITSKSKVYETAAAYVTDQPAFLNAVIGGETKLEPLVLLYTVKQIEREVGRTPTFKYGPRVIDIDVLFYDQDKINLPELVVPHPRLHERGFVLCPLADVAGDFVDPNCGKTVKELLALLPNTSDVVATQHVL